jgi:hypothetical protein
MTAEEKDVLILQFIVYLKQTALIQKAIVFWVVAPCSPVEVYRRFRDARCLHYQG